MKYFVILLSIVAFDFSLAETKLLPKGCYNIQEAGEMPDSMEWKDSKQCISKNQAIENLVKYIEMCGLTTAISIDDYSPNQNSNLARLFKKEPMYDGRNFLASESYRGDLRRELSKQFSEGSIRGEGNSGKILIYYSGNIYGENTNTLAVSCSGRVYEYETAVDFD